MLSSSALIIGKSYSPHASERPRPRIRRVILGLAQEGRATVVRRRTKGVRLTAVRESGVNDGAAVRAERGSEAAVDGRGRFGRCREKTGGLLGWSQWART